MGYASSLTINEVSTGASYTINERDIVFIGPDTLGAKITYVNEKDGVRRNIVTSVLPSTLATMSTSFIAATVNGQTVYVNIDRIDNLDSNSTGVFFSYDTEGQHDLQIQTSSTESAFYDSLFTKQGKTVYPFDAVNATDNTISLTAATGDKTAEFTNGVVLTVFGNSNDTANGIHVVSSSAFAGGKTVITLATNFSGWGSSGKIYIN
jgi:hypothetical protein